MGTGLMFNDAAALSMIDLLEVSAGVGPTSSVSKTPALPSSPASMSLNVVVPHSSNGETLRRHTNVELGDKDSSSNRETTSDKVDLSDMPLGETVRRCPEEEMRTTIRRGPLIDFDLTVLDAIISSSVAMVLRVIC